MRIIIPFMIFLLVPTAIFAADLEIFLNSYTQETNTAIIQIQNSGTKTLTEVYVQINDREKTRVRGTLNPGKGSVLIEALYPGQNYVTATTAEGIIATKTLNLGEMEERITNQVEGASVTASPLQVAKAKKLENLKKLQLLQNQVKEEEMKETEQRQKEARAQASVKQESLEAKRIVSEALEPLSAKSEKRTNLVLVVVIVLIILIALLAYPFIKRR